MKSIIGSNGRGKDLPAGNKKIKITGANLHAMWKKHKPTFDL